MLELTEKIMIAINEVFKRLNNLRRWTGFVTENRYNELSKQALNCITAYMLAAYCEHEGHKINWSAFPKIALYRAFQKVYVYFDTPEHIIADICKIGNIEQEQFDVVTQEIIAEEASPKFMEFISSKIGSYEFRIYRAATKIATYLELQENREKLKSTDMYTRKLRQILSALKAFSDIPGIDFFLDTEGKIFKLLQQVSGLRNQNRWAVMSYSTECPVLGHLFDTGIFAYLIALEKFPDDEALAGKFFFMGIFHDLPEVWTTDIPSPIKDRIPGFRKDTEVFENLVLVDFLYGILPDFLAAKIREVMFEDAANLQYKKLMKGADYLSADSECWRQYISGTRDDYFRGAMGRFEEQLKIGEKSELTPMCYWLHSHLLEYANRLNL